MTRTGLPAVRATLLALAAATILAGCGGGGGDAPALPPPPLVQGIQLKAGSSQLLPGSKPVGLTATLTLPGDVSWQLAAGSPGTLSASSGATISYAPPATVSAITPVTITASSGATSQAIKLTLFPDPGAPGLSLIAGTTGGSGLIDGKGTAARFRRINDMAADASGQLLVSESDYDGWLPPEQNRLRKVAADATVATLAKQAGGQQIGIVLSMQRGADGSFYFLDSIKDDDRWQLRVQARRADGSVSTLLDPASTDQQARLLLVAPDRTIYLLASSYITQVAPDGSSSVLAGISGPAPVPGADGQGTAASFVAIRDAVLAPDGNLYLIDAATVRRVTPAGAVTTVAGTTPLNYGDAAQLPVDGSGRAAKFVAPVSMALDGSGRLQVLELVDNKRYAIRLVSTAGTVSTVVLGNAPQQANPAFTYNALRLLRVDTAGHTLLATSSAILRLEGDQLQPYAGLDDDTVADIDGTGAEARLLRPGPLVVDSTGQLYVGTFPCCYGGGYQTGPSSMAVRKITPDGKVSTLHLTLPSDAISSAGSMAVGAGDVLYLAVVAPSSSLATTASGGAIYKVQPDGTTSLLAGNNKALTAQDGIGAAAAFSGPSLAGADADGNLYVRDRNPSSNAVSVRKVTPAGVVTTIAALPPGLNADSDGNTYTTDYNQGLVYRVAPDGSKAVVAGVADKYDLLLGALPGSLDHPPSVVRIGPATLAVVSRNAVIRVVLPH